MSDVQVTTVPKELYYHEVAYVRGLEARNAELVAALEGIIKANDDFRSQLPKDWDGDLVSDACERARAVLTAAGHKP